MSWEEISGFLGPRDGSPHDGSPRDGSPRERYLYGLDHALASNYAHAILHSAHAALPCPACGIDILGVSGLDEPGICVACRSLVVLDVRGGCAVREDNRARDRDGVHDADRAREDSRDRVREDNLDPDYVFGDVCEVELFLRRPTEEEEHLFLEMPSIRRAIAMVAQYHDRHGMPGRMDPPRPDSAE